MRSGDAAAPVLFFRDLDAKRLMIVEQPLGIEEERELGDCSR